MIRLCCLVFIPLLNSCQQQKETTYGNSYNIQPVIDSANSLFNKSKFDEGLHYVDLAVHSDEKASLNDQYKVYSSVFTYFSNFRKGDDDARRGLICADSMLAIANRNVNDPAYPTKYFDANFSIGDCYFQLQRFSEAYRHYFEGYMARRSSLNIVSLKKYTYRMGMITYKIGNYKLAADYFKKSYLLHTNTKFIFGEFNVMQELLDNIGLSFKHNNQPDSAMFYFDKAIKFIDKYSPQYKQQRLCQVARAVVYGNQGEVLSLKGDYKNATVMLKKSIAINLKKNYDNYDAELNEIRLAQIYFDHNNNSQLIGLLNTMRSQLDSVKNEDAEADWNHLMSGYYQREKDYQKALGYFQAYSTIKDSIVKKLTLLKENDINKQFDTYNKQQQIDELNSKNRFQKIYLLVITLFAIMTSIIVLLILRNWKRSKKDVLKVNLLNQQINEQNIVLENALNELKVNSQEKDRILRAVAHDLRNPLGGIASLTAIMAEDDCTDEQREQISLVRETSVNALELINEILEAANISSAPVNLELVDINSLAGNSVELLRFKAAEKGQQIFFEPLAKEQELYISREKIWRVISNLISNAIKFSPSGASIAVSIFEDDDQVVISVEDNGIGIPEKLRDQVFNMFTTAQRPGTAGEKSFGLGLSICRQIMERFKGKIWFESKPKGGTIFFISLPVAGTDLKNELTQKISVPLS